MYCMGGFGVFGGKRDFGGIERFWGEIGDFPPHLQSCPCQAGGNGGDFGEMGLRLFWGKKQQFQGQGSSHSPSSGDFTWNWPCWSQIPTVLTRDSPKGRGNEGKVP